MILILLVVVAIFAIVTSLCITHKAKKPKPVINVGGRTPEIIELLHAFQTLVGQISDATLREKLTAVCHRGFALACTLHTSFRGEEESIFAIRQILDPCLRGARIYIDRPTESISRSVQTRAATFKTVLDDAWSKTECLSVRMYKKKNVDSSVDYKSLNYTVKSVEEMFPPPKEQTVVPPQEVPELLNSYRNISVQLKDAWLHGKLTAVCHHGFALISVLHLQSQNEHEYILAIRQIIDNSLIGTRQYLAQAVDPIGGPPLEREAFEKLIDRCATRMEVLDTMVATRRNIGITGEYKSFEYTLKTAEDLYNGEAAN